MQYFGESIKDARIEKRLTREELSELSGLSKATILACERSRYIPSVSTLSALSKHIEIDMNKLVPELEKEKKRRHREKKYPLLVEFLAKKNMSQRQYAKLLGRSNEYLQNRFLSLWINFDAVDIQKTMHHFNLSPEEVVNIFIENISSNMAS